MNKIINLKFILFLIILKIFLVYYLIGIYNNWNYVEPPLQKRAPKLISDRNAKQINLIEESINSIGNQEACKLPNIPHDSPELLAFLKKENPLNCGNRSDEWVFCLGSLCSVKLHLLKEKGEIMCTFTEIYRQTDFKFTLSDALGTNTGYTLMNSDFARVHCMTMNGLENWNGIVVGARANITSQPEKMQLKSEYYNVLMFGFDSLSKNAVMRTLPNTYKYLTEDLNADVLQGYNIVGDGTPQALIPILTGYTELELPETRKRIKNSSYVDIYPMIWKEYKKHGYVTAFNEDTPNVGIFSYRLNGFEVQPTDHYLRTFYLAVGKGKKLCSGKIPSHQLMLDYTLNLAYQYREKPNFLFSFHGELSHDSITLVTLADDDIVNWLNNLESLNILDNTILIFMSDHGNRFAKIRNTLQGKQEERLPFFSFRFPDSFKASYPNEYNNFKENINKLTTPFDIHATLQHILELQINGTTEQSAEPILRSISLLKPIPEDRSCADAYIEPHWCACLQWETINEKSIEAEKSVNTFIKFINNYTSEYRDICEPLTLKNLIYVAKLKARESLINFHKTQDHDGFVPKFTDYSQIVIKEIYQIKVALNPGESLFEASISRDLKTNLYSIKLSDISRINEYGDQAKCIYDVNPELRKYCYCKN